MTDIIAKGIESLAEKENQYKEKVFKEINNIKLRQATNLILTLLTLVLLTIVLFLKK